MDNEVNIKTVSAAAIEDYLFCSLYFKYKNIFQLPYMPGSVKEAFYYSYKTALLKFFHEVGLANKPLRKCISEAQEIFVKKMRLALASFGKLDLSGEDLVAKGVLQLNEAHTLFNPDRDILAAIDLPVTVNYKSTSINYNLDVLMVKNDFTSARKFRVLGIADDFSDIALSNKHDGLQFGLMKQTIKEHFMTGKKGAGSFSEAKIEIIKVSGAKPSSSSTHHAPQPEFHLNPLVDNVITGIKNEVYLPTAQEQKCKSCWFNDICQTRHCGDTEVKQIEHVRTKLNNKARKIAENAATNTR